MGRPLSFNGYMYVEGDPVNMTDHTGNCADGWRGAACRDLARRMHRKYGGDLEKYMAQSYLTLLALASNETLNDSAFGRSRLVNTIQGNPRTSLAVAGAALVAAPVVFVAGAAAGSSAIVAAGYGIAKSSALAAGGVFVADSTYQAYDANRGDPSATVFSGFHSSVDYDRTIRRSAAAGALGAAYKIASMQSIGAFLTGAATNTLAGIAGDILTSQSVTLGDVAIDAAVGGAFGQIASWTLGSLPAAATVSRNSGGNITRQGYYTLLNSPAAQFNRTLARGSLVGILNVAQGSKTRFLTNEDTFWQDAFNDYFLGLTISTSVDVAGRFFIDRDMLRYTIGNGTYGSRYAEALNEVLTRRLIADTNIFGNPLGNLLSRLYNHFGNNC